MFEITPFLQPGDPWLASEDPELVRRIYREKYHIAAMLRPRSLLEIGVRTGEHTNPAVEVLPIAGPDPDLGVRCGCRVPRPGPLCMVHGPPPPPLRMRPPPTQPLVAATQPVGPGKQVGVHAAVDQGGPAGLASGRQCARTVARAGPLNQV